MKKTLSLLLGVLTISVSAHELLLVDDNSTDIHDPYYVNYANLDDVEGILDEMGIDYDHEWDNRHRYPGITADPTFLASYDIIIWYNDNRAIEQAEYDAVLDWVGEGNYLVVTGYDSLGNPNDPRMANLIGSVTYGDYPYCDSFGVSNSDNWIMDGPWGYFQGVFDILHEATDHDWALAAPGTVKIAGTFTGGLIGPDKILLTEDVGEWGGIIVYWNGNWDSVEWWRKSQTMDTVNMFRNIMSRLNSTVEEVSWGKIKDIFTP